MDPALGNGCLIQTIYQDIALVKSMSILRNIFAGRELKNALGFLRMKEMREIAMEILSEHVKIAGITSPDLLVEELSGGQAQAVAIARAVPSLAGWARVAATSPSSRKLSA